MDFFSHQDKAKRTSHLILLAFVLAMAVVGVMIHFAVALLSVLAGHADGIFELSQPAAALIVILWTVMLLGGFFRLLDVRAGGAALAERYGATQAVASSRRDDEIRLLNVVAEMSIASASAPPAVYVLRRENSINAFVVGADAGRRALVVSQGALDRLDRDALQAVVAHEFAHVVQGDLAVNMRLLVAMGALNAVDEVGQMLVGDVTFGRSGIQDLFSQRRDALMHPGVIVGLLLRLVGSAGTLAGQILRAAFSRQREFLADATGVQFTRNPLAMARALTIIDRQGDANHLHSPYHQELAHLCFHIGRAANWYRGLIASHPPLQDRVDAIDPHYAVKERKEERARQQTEQPRTQNASASINPDFASVPILMTSVVTAAVHSEVVGAADAEVGRSGQARSDVARQGRASSGVGGPGVARPGLERPGLERPGLAGPSLARPGLTPVETARSVAANADDYWARSEPSDRIVLLLGDEKKCLAALFALFAGDGPDRRSRYLSTLAEIYTAAFSEAVQQILQLIPDELNSDQFGIVRHVCERLSTSSSIDNRKRILIGLEQVLEGSGQFDLMNYAILQLVRRTLEVDFPIIEAVCEQGQVCASRRGVKSFDAMGSEFALLLSLMVESSGAPEEAMERDFQRVLKCYTAAEHQRRSASEPGIVDDLEAAFQTLYVQPQSTREAFVQHCVEIMKHDGHVARAERTLLNLFAASLGCTLAA